MWSSGGLGVTEGGEEPSNEWDRVPEACFTYLTVWHRAKSLMAEEGKGLVDATRQPLVT